MTASATPSAAELQAAADLLREQMNIVIVGHVDHGKSTLVGRLLADSGSLPDGKLEFVQGICKRQGKKFEYAFLLDALEAEQDQGITIDSARVFFKTTRRDVIIIDAPGHIEFLKNMISGAARAEAALLLIDANEGVQENSRRHGYMLSMLGIRQVTVCVNKMDLVDYDQDVFDRIEAEYREFLSGLGVVPERFIPISAREGDEVAKSTDAMTWYTGPTVLEAVDLFEKAPSKEEQLLRLPVQDVYKFNFRGDDRRIIAGRIESGRVSVGDKLVFSPSGKSSTVATIEQFSAPQVEEMTAPQCVGLTLTEQIYVDRGDIATHVEHAPHISTRLRVNIFWMGRRPMLQGRWYKLKLTTMEVRCRIHELVRVIDASVLDSELGKDHVGRHDVAELILETRKPVAFDRTSEMEATGRFVIVDEYDVAGGGIVMEPLDDDLEELRQEARERDFDWERGYISQRERQARSGHKAGLVLLTGDAGVGKHLVAKVLEQQLFENGATTYLLDAANVFLGVDHDLHTHHDTREAVRRYAEVAYLFLDAGHVVVSTSNTFGLADHRVIDTLVGQSPVVFVHVGDGAGEDSDLVLATNPDAQDAAAEIREVLIRRGILDV